MKASLILVFVLVVLAASAFRIRDSSKTDSPNRAQYGDFLPPDLLALADKGSRVQTEQPIPDFLLKRAGIKSRAQKDAETDAPNRAQTEGIAGLDNYNPSSAPIFRRIQTETNDNYFDRFTDAMP